MSVSTSDVQDGSRFLETMARLHALERGSAISTPRIKRISYVHNVMGGGGGMPQMNVSDMVVLDQFDEEGNVSKKGQVIVQGSRKELKHVTSHINPVDKSRRRNVVPIEFKILDPQKARKPWERSRPPSAKPTPETKGQDKQPETPRRGRPVSAQTPTRTPPATPQQQQFQQLHRPAPPALDMDSVLAADLAHVEEMPMSHRRLLASSAPLDSARTRRHAPPHPTPRPASARAPRGAQYHAMYTPRGMPGRYLSSAQPSPSVARGPASSPSQHRPPRTGGHVTSGGGGGDGVSGGGGEEAVEDQQSDEKIGGLVELRKILRHLTTAHEEGALSRSQFESAAHDIEARSRQLVSARGRPACDVQRHTLSSKPKHAPDLILHPAPAPAPTARRLSFESAAMVLHPPGHGPLTDEQRMRYLPSTPSRHHRPLPAPPPPSSRRPQSARVQRSTVTPAPPAVAAALTGSPPASSESGRPGPSSSHHPRPTGSRPSAICRAVVPVVAQAGSSSSPARTPIRPFSASAAWRSRQGGGIIVAATPPPRDAWL